VAISVACGAVHRLGFTAHRGRCVGFAQLFFDFNLLLMRIDRMSKLAFFYISVLLLPPWLVGCSGRQHSYTVGGVEARFCVPEKLRVGDLWWIPENSPTTPAGFSFTGCSEAGASETSCDVPLALIGASVESREVSPREDWAAMKSSAAFSLFSNDPTTAYRIDEKTNYVVLSAARFKEWFIFQKNDGAQAGPVLEDKDLLVAYCARSADIAGASSHASREDFACHRRVRGSEYTVAYFFASADPVPANLKALDTTVLHAVDSWKCE
jgi:hypothetical protein